jgi:hypothetical protein
MALLVNASLLNGHLGNFSSRRLRSIEKPRNIESAVA